MFFDSWADIGRVLVIGPLAYFALLLLLRVSGKRTLSKMNMFDFIVTVALGSTLASALLSEDVALVEGLVALAVLIFSQFVITFLSVRFEPFQQFVKADPALLYHEDRFLRRALRRERVTEEEVRAAVRARGYRSLESVAAVVLETEGSFSVLAKSDSGQATSLANVPLLEDEITL